MHLAAETSLFSCVCLFTLFFSLGQITISCSTYKQKPSASFPCSLAKYDDIHHSKADTAYHTSNNAAILWFLILSLYTYYTYVPVSTWSHHIWKLRVSYFNEWLILLWLIFQITLWALQWIPRVRPIWLSDTDVQIAGSKRFLYHPQNSIIFGQKNLFDDLQYACKSTSQQHGIQLASRINSNNKLLSKL